ATLPPDTKHFAHHGSDFYAAGAGSMTLHVSANTGGMWSDVSVPDTVLSLAVAPDGSILVFTGTFTYRSKDHGQSWQREQGLHEAYPSKVAWADATQGMAATWRGTLRFHP